MRMSSSTQSVTSLVSLNERPSSPSLVSAPDTEEDLEVGVVRVVPATCPKLEAAERAYAEAQREYEQRLAAADRSNRQLIVAKAATIRCNGERMQANRSQASAHVKQPLVAEKTELDERLDYICAERDDLKAKLEDANRELASLRKGLEEIVDPGDREAQVAQRRNPKWGHDDPIFISIQGSVYRISMRMLRRESSFFEDQLLGTPGTDSSPRGLDEQSPVELPGFTQFEMDSLLHVLHASPFSNDLDTLTLSQWAAVLHLSTEWSFDRIRQRAIDLFDAPAFADQQDALDRLDLAFQCHVPQWVLPAYDALCRRVEPLSAEEGPRLGWTRFAALCRLREWLARGGEEGAPLGEYEYLAEFSEESPVVLPLAALEDVPSDSSSVNAGRVLPDETPQGQRSSSPGTTNGSVDASEDLRSVIEFLEDQDELRKVYEETPARTRMSLHHAPAVVVLEQGSEQDEHFREEEVVPPRPVSRSPRTEAASETVPAASMSNTPFITPLNAQHMVSMTTAERKMYDEYKKQQATKAAKKARKAAKKAAQASAADEKALRELRLKETRAATELYGAKTNRL